MALDLADYERKAAEAVKTFWSSRDTAQQQQITAGTTDSGTRGAVTAGKNMIGFAQLVADIVSANGLAHVDIYYVGKKLVTLPGYYRATKQWDVLVLDKGELVAAIELKSQVGSFSNNFNNRTEEAIGTAHDLWTAYKEGALGNQQKPFLGWLMLCEDHSGSRCTVRETSPHFNVFPEFRGTSYLQRYDLLCQRLVKEQLYAAAAVLASPATAVIDGSFTEFSVVTGLRAFVTTLAGHIATYAAMNPPQPSRLL